MKIREENCNMFLLAVVTVFIVIAAAGASLVGPTDTVRSVSPLAPSRLRRPTSRSSLSPTSRRCASSARRSCPMPIRAADRLLHARWR
jgi:hypothetical protein